MNVSVWLDGEMKEFSTLLQQFKRKQMKNVPIWMALCIIGMVALGVVAGYDIGYVARVHLVIGVGLAALIWLGYWIQNRVANVKRARAAYEKELKTFFCSAEDEQAFCRQMESHNYDAVHFMNTGMESYPGRFLVGPDYWVFFSGGGYCRMFRTADIKTVYGREETTRVNVAGRGRRMTVGVSFVAEYKEGSPSAKGGKESTGTVFLQKGEQYKKLLETVMQRCPGLRG